MMFTPCCPSAGPIGGAGLAAPAWIWSLIRPVTFFLGGIRHSLGWWAHAVGDDPVAWPGGRPVRFWLWWSRSDLGDLVERQLDRRLAAEDRDQHLELLALGVDLGDGGGQGLERAVGDGDRLAHGELDLHRRRAGQIGRASCRDRG